MRQVSLVFWNVFARANSSFWMPQWDIASIKKQYFWIVRKSRLGHKLLVHFSKLIVQISAYKRTHISISVEIIRYWWLSGVLPSISSCVLRSGRNRNGWVHNAPCTMLFLKPSSLTNKYISTVYDITRQSTLPGLRDRWIKEIRENARPDVPIILVGKRSRKSLVGTWFVNKFHFSTIISQGFFVVGSKCDLENERMVQRSEVEEICTNIPEIKHAVESSAKTNENIEFIFNWLATEMKVIVHRTLETILVIIFERFWRITKN